MPIRRGHEWNRGLVNARDCGHMVDTKQRCRSAARCSLLRCPAYNRNTTPATPTQQRLGDPFHGHADPLLNEPLTRAGPADTLTPTLCLTDHNAPKSLDSSVILLFLRSRRERGYEPGGRRFESCRAHQPLTRIAVRTPAALCPILCPPREPAPYIIRVSNDSFAGRSPRRI